MRGAVITGAAGFLGPYLCERVRDDNFELACLDSFLTGIPKNVEHFMGDRKLHPDPHRRRRHPRCDPQVHPQREIVRQPDITLPGLDWSPKVSIEDALKQTIAWFRRHPEPIGDHVSGIDELEGARP